MPEGICSFLHNLQSVWLFKNDLQQVNRNDSDYRPEVAPPLPVFFYRIASFI
ncbi:hypothetical protein FLA_5742 [Filimonas lacunae]|nr:hypothetical protein FLA_5742 [Filimonas lacunae]